MYRSTALAFLLLTTAYGCGDVDCPEGAEYDGRRCVRVVADASMDGAMEEGGPADSGPDAGDAGPDAGSDAGELDDGGPIDAGGPDAGEEDAGPTDAGPTDAGPTDAGDTDAWVDPCAAITCGPCTECVDGTCTPLGDGTTCSGGECVDGSCCTGCVEPDRRI